MSQLKMFATGLNEELKPTDPAKLARTTDPAPSKLAARQFTQSGELASHEECIVWCSDSIGRDWTSHELAKYSERTGSPMDSVQITRRLKGLREKHVLEHDDDRECMCCSQIMSTHRSRKEQQ